LHFAIVCSLGSFFLENSSLRFFDLRRRRLGRRSGLLNLHNETKSRKWLPVVTFDGLSIKEELA
jgi:hypothetical protein